jgi:hypothetical protein
MLLMTGYLMVGEALERSGDRQCNLSTYDRMPCSIENPSPPNLNQP